MIKIKRRRRKTRNFTPEVMKGKIINVAARNKRKWVGSRSTYGRCWGNPEESKAVRNRSGKWKRKRNSNKSEEDKMSKKGPKQCVKITIYQNGFQVDDGPFRDYKAPENKEFMSTVKEG